LTVSSAQAQTVKIINLTSTAGRVVDRPVPPDQVIITSEKEVPEEEQVSSMVIGNAAAVFAHHPGPG